MKHPLLILIFYLAGLPLFAQAEKTQFYGTTASADFGRFQDRIEISPMAGIKVLPKIYAGLGITLAYFSIESVVLNKNNDSWSESKTKDQIGYSGGQLFIRHVPFEQKEGLLKSLYLQVAYEALWGNGTYSDASGKYQYSLDNFTPFAGIGYKQALWNRFSIGALLCFKLNDEKDSPYQNPIFRISFEF